MNQHYSQGLMVGLGVTFIIVPSIFVALRIWAKRLKSTSLRLDDYLCLGALAIGITCSALQLYGEFGGSFACFPKRVLTTFQQLPLTVGWAAIKRLMPMAIPSSMILGSLCMRE